MTAEQRHIHIELHCLNFLWHFNSFSLFFSELPQPFHGLSSLSPHQTQNKTMGLCFGFRLTPRLRCSNVPLHSPHSFTNSHIFFPSSSSGSFFVFSFSLHFQFTNLLLFSLGFGIIVNSNSFSFTNRDG